MQKNSLSKNISCVVVLILSLVFVAKAGGPALLRQYIQSGIGDCQKIPILCMAPTEEINTPNINKEYVRKLLPYKSPEITIAIPKDFSIFQEKIKKGYYKKMRCPHKDTVIYPLYEEPNFFVNLFPRLKKQGVEDDYEFIKRVMCANLRDIKNFTDAFFVIMKSIFIPDLGEQKNVKMAQFSVADKRGFINYNLGKADNYFDCNVINRQGGFFKIYIKDRGANLDLEKVLAIISTAESAK